MLERSLDQQSMTQLAQRIEDDPPRKSLQLSKNKSAVLPKSQ